MEIVKVLHRTNKGEKTGYFIKIIKGYVPIEIQSGILADLDVIEKKPLEINEYSGEVK